MNEAPLFLNCSSSLMLFCFPESYHKNQKKPATHSCIWSSTTASRQIQQMTKNISARKQKSDTKTSNIQKEEKQKKKEEKKALVRRQARRILYFSLTEK